MNVTESDFQKCFDVNVKSIFYGTSAFIPRLLKQADGGSIVNVASVGATRPRPGLVWYNASKGAIWNVSEQFDNQSLATVLLTTRRLPRDSQLNSDRNKSA